MAMLRDSKSAIISESKANTLVSDPGKSELLPAVDC